MGSFRRKVRHRARGGEVLDTEYWSPEVVEVRKGAVSWAASTRNFRSQYGAQRGGVELTVLGPPEAQLEVETAPFSGGGRLGDLLGAGRLGLGSGEAGILGLQLGTGGLLGLGTEELAVDFEEPVAEPSWYYLRLTLVDGEMAWSSPVWVSPGEV